MNVGIDIDDTINEFSIGLARYLDRELGIDSLPIIHEKYHITEVTGWPRERVVEFFEKHEKELYLDTPLKQDAREMIRGLTLRHMNLHIVTNRMERRREVTMDWLFNKDLGPFLKTVIFAPGCKLEAARARGLQLDLMIEDRADRALPFLQADIPVILFNYPHNKHLDHRLLHRVDNWWQVFEAAARIQVQGKRWMR